MTAELDHIFICASPGAPEAERLVELGLQEGTPNRHPGQGTANRRFFFHNAMLELLWVHDPAAARGERIRPTRLWERWSGRDTGACPFGVCWRPAGADSIDAPFPAWDYHPPYLPATLAVQVGSDTPITEPMWFCLGSARRPDSEQADRRQPLEHPIGFEAVTAVRFTSPVVRPLSVVAQTILQAGMVSLRSGSEYLLEVMFDGSQTGHSADFRPALPLVFRW